MPTADLVARIRTATGDTQEGLARRLGVSFPTINAWERGRSEPRRIHREKLEQLADELGVPRGVKILVIDDDPTTGELVSAAAQEVDPAIEVEAALDGWEGLIRCGTLRPQMLFLDILMPGLDGIEVARRLPGIEGLDEMVVAFVTSSRDPNLLARARSLAESVLLKPLTVDDLVRAIKLNFEAAGV